MNNLPNELLLQVFSFLSQRYVSVASSVCKKWLMVARDPQFYKSVSFYSISQFEKFLNIVSTLKITKKNIPVGHFIYEMNVSMFSYEQFRMTQEEIDFLYDNCPHLTKINVLDTSFVSRCGNFPCWPYLSTLPYWCTLTNQSMAMHKQFNITSLEHVLGCSSSNEINNNNNNNIIQIQTDQRKRYRYKKQCNDRYNSFHFIQLPTNDEGLVEHYGKTILFYSPHLWSQLKSLSLQFYNIDYRSHTYMYEYDERVLDTIRITCPQLESLTLKHFFMNLSDDYLSTTRLRAIDSPHSSLQQVHFHDCYIHDIECFDYISKLYPNITDLQLQLYWNDKLEECGPYKLAFFKMITSFIYLKNLSTYIKEGTSGEYYMLSPNFNVVDKLWPYAELYQWLIDHPTQLEALDNPMDLRTMEDYYLKQYLPPCDDSNDNAPTYGLHHRLSYLRHLSTLTLHLKKNTSQELFYLQENGRSTHVSLSITSLIIHKGTETYSSQFCDKGPDSETLEDFFIYDWLNAFPNLKTLDLKLLCNIKTSSKRKRDNDDDQQQKQQWQKEQYPTFGLKELIITAAYIHMNNDHLKEFFTSFPSLRSLTFDQVNFVDPTLYPVSSSFDPALSTMDNDNKNESEYLIIDIPHIQLDRLTIIRVQHGAIRSSHRYFTTSAKCVVNELDLNNTFEIVKSTTLYRPSNVIVNCKSVDVVHFPPGWFTISS